DLVEPLAMQVDVRRLEVAMDDVAVVAVADAHDELLEPAHPERYRRRTVPAQLRVERLALQALEHEEGLPAIEAEAEDLAHVPAVHGGEQQRLAREALVHLT